MAYKIVKYGKHHERRNYSKIRNTYELKDLLANPAQDTDLIRTAKELREKTTRYTEVSLLLNFNCGAYLEKYYKGSGTEDHGYVKISNKLFAKLLETKSL